MATMTLEPATIRTAMSNIGLDDRIGELLDQIDEIELDQQLKISLEQAEKGEEEDVFEALEGIRKEIRNER